MPAQFNTCCSDRSGEARITLPLILILFSLISATGCNQGAKKTLDESSIPTAGATVFAQGQILPADGMVRLAGTPGIVVDQVHVDVGQRVEAGAPVLTLQSYSVLEKQVAAAKKQLQEAQLSKKQATAQAERGVAAAHLKMKQIEEREESLETDQARLLAIAEEQLKTAEGILVRLTKISQDSLTSEFVSQVEVDRQRMAIAEAELQVETQRVKHKQAKDELVWQREVAVAELASAKELLQVAKASSADEVIQANIERLEQQRDSSIIRSPLDGVVLAVDVHPGEMCGQMPLVELANLDAMVCEIEINEMDAASVQIGDRAEISSRAFEGQTLSGSVKEVYRVVGRPQLKPFDPLARADYRSVIAVVEITDGADLAAKWLQLQVEVRVSVGQSSTSTSPSGGSGPSTSSKNEKNEDESA